MPAPTLTPGDNKQDDTLNPGQHDYDRRFNDITGSGSEYPDVEKGLRDLEKHANNPSEESQRNDSIGDQERNTAQPGAINSSYTGARNKSKVGGFFKQKKKSAIAGIAVLLLGGGGLFATLFTPGLGIIQMKEILTSDLNDQLAAMDIRSEHVFRAKLKGMSHGVCAGAVQIKCRFTSMSDKQIERFKKAGFVIADDGVKESAFGRKIITSMTAPDGTEIKNPTDLTRARTSSPQVRSAMNRVFNPTYYSFSDKVANTFFVKNKTDKQKKIKGKSEEERKKSLKQATAGEKVQGGVLKAKDGRAYILDEDGTRTYATGEGAEPEKFNRLKSELDGKTAKITAVAEGGKVAGKVISGSVRGLGILGTVDSACVAYTTARAVAAGAKIARSMQLVQFAMVLNSTADSIKAGDATPEEAEFVGTMLATTDNRKTVIDETTGNTIDNPFYGKSGYDAPGIKTASYNDAPTLTAQSQQYMVGGGLSGTLSSVMSGIESSIGGDPKNIRTTCGFVQSPWVRGAGLIAGIALSIGSFGVSTVLSIAASTAVGLAIPLLEAMLTDMVAGNVIDENIASVDAGDAWFAGTAAASGGIAQNRGMTPQSVESFKEYAAVTSDSLSSMVAAEKYEAQKTPFDVTNQYSFIGSFARSLYPASLTAKSGLSGAVTSLGTVLNKGFSSITGTVGAAKVFNEERFSKCNDPGYQELGIDADIFCNVRYGLTENELSMDTEEVVDYMLAKNYIASNGKPQSTYVDFLKNCANRTDGWGETSEEGGSIGLECIDGSTETYPDISYFRVYTFDKGVSDAMDGDVDPGEEEYPGGTSGIGLVGDKAPPLSGDASQLGSTYEGHRGVDFGAPQGTPIYTVAAGTVVRTFTGCSNQNGGFGDRCGSGWGNHVLIQHENGTQTLYAHIYSGADVLVSEGQAVVAGQHIGNVGSTGSSTFNHLHFEVWEGGSRIGDQGTFDWLKQYNILPKPQESLRWVD